MFGLARPPPREPAHVSAANGLKPSIQHISGDPVTKAADTSSLKSLQQKAFPNILAQLIEDGFPPEMRADHLKRVQRWLNDNTLAVDLEEAIAATGVRRWHTKRERTQLLDFVRNRLLITHSLLCNRLGHPQLNLPNPGE